MDTQKFDPKILNNLEQKDIDQLRNLTDAEISQLAKLFPNAPGGNNYLVLEDTRKGVKQLYPFSSFVNLDTLRNKLNQKYWVIKTLRSKFNATKSQPGKVAPIQDLTAKDIKNAAGLKQTDKIAKPQTSAPVKDDVKNDEVIEKELSADDFVNFPKLAESGLVVGQKISQADFDEFTKVEDNATDKGSTVIPDKKDDEIEVTDDVKNMQQVKGTGGTNKVAQNKPGNNKPGAGK